MSEKTMTEKELEYATKLCRDAIGFAWGGLWTQFIRNDRDLDKLIAYLARMAWDRRSRIEDQHWDEFMHLATEWLGEELPRLLADSVDLDDLAQDMLEYKDRAREFKEFEQSIVDRIQMHRRSVTTGTVHAIYNPGLKRAGVILEIDT